MMNHDSGSRLSTANSACHAQIMRPAPAMGFYRVMKRSILAFGVLGLVGCFLPLVAGVSWFELRHLDESWTIWLVMAAFAFPALSGASRSAADRVAALVGTACFGYLAFKFRGGVFDLIVHGS